MPFVVFGRLQVLRLTCLRLRPFHEISVLLVHVSTLCRGCVHLMYLREARRSVKRQ